MSLFIKQDISGKKYLAISEFFLLVVILAITVTNNEFVSLWF